MAAKIYPVVLNKQISDLRVAGIQNQYVKPKHDNLLSELTELYNSLARDVDDALASVNGRGTSFTTTSYYEVLALVHLAERQLDDSGVTMKNRTGCTVRHRKAGPSANAYKYSAQATLVTLRRDSKGTWRMISAERCDVHPKQPEMFNIKISRAAADDVTRNAMKPFIVA